MVGKIKPVVTVMLDKERHLKLTLSGMIAFNEATGKDMLHPDTQKQLNSGMLLTDLRALLWACLRWEDKSLTLEQAGDLLDTDNLAEVVAKIQEATMAAMPEGDKDQVPLAGKPQGG